MKNTGYKKSAELLERAKKVLAGGVSSEFRKANYPHAMFYTHGEGSRIYDVDGNEYLDFTLSQGPLILGHSHPEVVQAVSEYSMQGQLFAGQHIQELQLAEKIQEIIPSAERMRFCLDGSEAVQTAFRLARAITGKKKFLRFEGHYHGWLDNVCWGISAPSAFELGNRENPTVFPWTEGLPEFSTREFIIIPWNDSELFRETMHKHHHEIAAVITEPVMCNNGCITPQEGYLELLRELCTQLHTALIFDEVITGFRLGLGGAQKHFGVTPDLSVFAKAMASGYPISAIVGKEEWMRPISEGRVIHAGTMNSGNSSVAAALATIKVLEMENTYSRLFQFGQQLISGLKTIAKETEQNLIVMGPGPMFCIAFTQQETSVKEYRDTLLFDRKKLATFIARMHDRNIRIIGRGLWYLSLAHSEEDIERALTEARDVLTEMKRSENS